MNSASRFMFYGGGGEKRLVMIALATSLICHGIIFSVLIYAQTHQSQPRSTPIVMNVSLVSLPEYAGPSKQVSKPSVSEEKKTTEKSVAVNQKSVPRTADAPKTVKKKISLKKETYKSEKVKKSTLEKLEKKIETNATDRIAKAIDEIKAKIDRGKENQPSKESTAQASESNRLAGDGETNGGKLAEVIDIYRMEIALKVHQNWAFPDQLADGQSDLQTLLVFKVLPNGEIMDLFFTDRSGNSHFDESAFRAVMKANPVDPHPGAISQPYVQMGLRFTPEGIQ